MRKLAILTAVSLMGCAPASGDGGNGSGGRGNSGGVQGTSSGGAQGAGTGGVSAASTGGAQGSGSGGRPGTSSGGAQGSGGVSAGSTGGTPGMGSGGVLGGGAGRAGATGGGAGSGPVGSGCGDRPYKLCEDFEAAEPGGLPPGWAQFELYQQGKPGTVNVQTDQFHGGAKALKSSSAAIDQPRVRRSLLGLGTTLANNHWGRIFYKVQIPAPRPNTYFHLTFAALTKEPAAPESRIVDTVQDPTGRLQYLYNLPDDTCCTMTGFSGAYDAMWHCAEWFISQATNSYRFFLDGREIPISFTGNTRARIANITYIALGTSFYQIPATPFVAWIDDLAINDTQIGCGP
jgi:hypothetical protein